VVVCAVGFSLLGVALGGPRAGMSVALGGAAASINLYVLARLGQVSITRDGHATRWGLVVVLKTLLLFGGVALAVRCGLGSWLAGFAAGYSSLLGGIAFATLFRYAAREPGLDCDQNTAADALSAERPTPCVSLEDTDPNGN
jgi:hypothetical protein